MLSLFIAFTKRLLVCCGLVRSFRGMRTVRSGCLCIIGFGLHWVLSVPSSRGAILAAFAIIGVTSFGSAFGPPPPPPKKKKNVIGRRCQAEMGRSDVCALRSYVRLLSPPCRLAPSLKGCAWIYSSDRITSIG